MVFKHYIVTRFNLPNKWLKDKTDNKVLNESWLVDRYHLFYEYCLPSMIGQVDKNFEWWVYFDINTPAKFLLKNKRLSEEFSNFKPKYVKNYQEFENAYIQDIKIEIKELNLEYILTTRLDNDDALHKFFVKSLQQVQINKTKILEFPTGLTLNIENLELRKYSSRNNPFISLLEKVKNQENILGIYSREHGNWEGFNAEIVSNKPYWMQVIHKKNIYNRARGELVLRSSLRFFEIKKLPFSIAYIFPIKFKMLKKYIKNL